MWIIGLGFNNCEYPLIVVGYEKRDHFAQNAIFCLFFKLSPFQGLASDLIC